MKRAKLLSIGALIIVSTSYGQRSRAEKFVELDTSEWEHTERQAWETNKGMTNTLQERRGKNSEGDIPIITPNNRTLTRSEEVTLQAIVPDFLVSKNLSGWNLFSPSIAVDGSGNFVIAWEDHNYLSYVAIYAQRYNSSGVVQGTNFKVDDNAASWGQHGPSIAIDESGNFVIAWQENVKGYGDIYAKRYNSSGAVQGTKFKVDNDTGTSDQISPSIAVDGSGNFVIAWEDGRNNQRDIYAQRYNSSGVVQGTNFRVNDDTQSFNQYAPSIAVNESGNFVIAWQDWRNDKPDIYAQRYNSSGAAQGKNFKVNDDTKSRVPVFPAIAMDWSGNFVIAWDAGDDLGHWDINAQRYNSSGVVQGTNFIVNDDAGMWEQSSPSIAMDVSGNFVITWEDWRGDIYAQRYNSSGATLGINFRVTAEVNNQQFSPNVKLWNKRIYNTWASDHIDGMYYDIWANVLDWNGPLSVSKPADDNRLSAIGYQLGQNYPNPFNPETNIDFAIPKDEYTTLKIYDMNGRLVKTLVDENTKAGYYSTKWNGINEKGKIVSSGTYLYHMISGEYSAIKWMVLLK